MDLIKINKNIENALKNDIFPGYAVGIYNKEIKNIFTGGYTSYKKHKSINTSTLFDLASLTKPFATTLSCLVLLEEKKINYEMTLESLLGRAIPDDKKNITLSHLLSHSSGLIGHKEFYKDLEKIPFEKRKERLLNSILNSPLEADPGQKAIYSDLGFILLFFIVEYQAKMDFEPFVYDRVFTPMGIQDICYNPKEKGYIDFAVTEECKWRKREIIGEVHDQNTSVLNGVSGQAGLFGTIDSVLSLVMYIKEMCEGKKIHPYIDNTVLKDAVTRRDRPKSTSWGYGFDTPSQPGSSAGKFISKKSCGHLGFTGTSFWIDFDKDIVVVLLTNRINPSVDNLKIRDFRPLFHDLIFA